jgi:hypothetical protein
MARKQMVFGQKWGRVATCQVENELNNERISSAT